MKTALNFVGQLVLRIAQCARIFHRFLSRSNPACARGMIFAQVFAVVFGVFFAHQGVLYAQGYQNNCPSSSGGQTTTCTFHTIETSISPGGVARQQTISIPTSSGSNIIVLYPGTASNPGSRRTFSLGAGGFTTNELRIRSVVFDKSDTEPTCDSTVTFPDTTRRSWEFESEDDTGKYVCFQIGVAFDRVMAAYRLVEVPTIDRTDPVFLNNADTQPEIASDNSFNSDYAINGSTLTVTFEFNEALGATPTATIAGQNATVSGSGTTYTATYQLTEGDGVGDGNAVEFDVGVAEDVAGNDINPPMVTLDDITIDRTAPFVDDTTPELSSDNSNDAYATNGDTLRLTFRTNEPTSSFFPDVEIHGQSATHIFGAIDFAFDYTLRNTDAFADGDQVPVTAEGFRDFAGNLGTPFNAIVTDVTIDRTDPMFTAADNQDFAALTRLPEATDDNGVSYAVTPAFPTAGVEYDAANHRITGTPTDADVAAGPYSLTATDPAGNDATLMFNVLTLQLTALTVTPESGVEGAEFVVNLTRADLDGGDTSTGLDATPIVLSVTDGSEMLVAGVSPAVGSCVESTYDATAETVALTFPVGVAEVCVTLLTEDDEADEADSVVTVAFSGMTDTFTVTDNETDLAITGASASPNPVSGRVLGEEVTLTAGAEGGNLNGGAYTYLWEQDAGDTNQVTLTNADTDTATFTAPDVAANVDLTFTLTLDDQDADIAAVTETVVVTVNALELPAAPRGLGAENITHNAATINWNAAARASDYSLTLTPARDGDPAGETIPNIGDVTTYALTGLNPDRSPRVEYTLTLIAHNISGGSDQSSALRFSTTPFVALAVELEDFAVDECAMGVALPDAAAGGETPYATVAWEITPAGIPPMPADSVTSTFDAPSVSADTEYMVTLTVTDSDTPTPTTETDTATLTVRDLPFTANAGGDRRVSGGDTVTLNARAAGVPGGGCTFDPAGYTYAWGQIPPADIAHQVTLTSTDATATFVAPEVTQVTELEFSVTISGNGDTTDPDTITITVFPPTPMNVQEAATAHAVGSVVAQATSIITSRIGAGALGGGATLGGASLNLSDALTTLCGARGMLDGSREACDVGSFGDLLRAGALGYSHTLLGGGDIHVWGQGARNAFAGDVTEGEGAGASYDGDTDGVHLGVEHDGGRGLVVGVAVSEIDGEIDVTNAGGSKTAQDFSLRGVSPYLRREVGDHAMWLLLGFARGESEDLAGKTKFTSQTFGAGFHHKVAGENARRMSKSEFHYHALGGDLDAVSWRARQALSWEQRLHLANGQMRRAIEVGARADAGEVQESLSGNTLTAGLDLAGEFGYVGDPLSVDVRLHSLVWHTANDLRESGMSVRVSHQSRNARGLQLALQPEWGAAGDSESLVDADVFADADADAETPGETFGWSPKRVNLKLGYGFDLRGVNALVTPLAEWSRRDVGERVKFGVRWLGGVKSADSLRLDLFVENRAGDANRIQMQGRLDF